MKKLLILFVLMFITLYAVVALAADTGAKVTGTVESVGNWGNFTTTRINTSDDSKASCINAAQCTGTLSDYTFGIPNGATIDGIEVIAELSCGGGGCTGGTDDSQLSLKLSWDNGSTYTAVKSTTAGDLTPTDANFTFGGSTDTWGRTWDDAEFADGTFMVDATTINVTAAGDNGDSINIDYLTITVYYTPAAALPTTLTMSNGTSVMSNGTNIMQ